jgi:hypothetical protein
MVTLCCSLEGIILENNIPQKEGETHYNLAHYLEFVGADRLE